MARIYGKNSRYLLKNDAKYYFLAAGLVVLPLVLIWLVMRFSNPFVTAVGALILIIVLITILNPFIRIFKRKSGKFYRGRGGELDIRRELEGLPDIFTVFQDLNIPGQYGNIDFAVVGPTGIFSIEVKSHKGVIGYNGFELTLSGRIFPEKNVLKQAFGEAMRLKNFLKTETGKDVFVKPLLVFSRGYGMHFGLNPVNNVCVIGKEFLLEAIVTQPAYAFPVPREVIEERLKSLIKI